MNESSWTLLEFKFWCSKCFDYVDVCINAISQSKTRIILCQKCDYNITAIEEIFTDED